MPIPAKKWRKDAKSLFWTPIGQAQKAIGAVKFWLLVVGAAGAAVGWTWAYGVSKSKAADLGLIAVGLAAYIHRLVRNHGALNDRIATLEAHDLDVGVREDRGNIYVSVKPEGADAEEVRLMVRRVPGNGARDYLDYHRVHPFRFDLSDGQRKEIRVAECGRGRTVLFLRDEHSESINNRPLTAPLGGSFQVQVQATIRGEVQKVTRKWSMEPDPEEPKSNFVLDANDPAR